MPQNWTSNDSQLTETPAYHCAVACTDAVAHYFNWLIAAVGTPAPPVLVAGTLSARALSLEWEAPERLRALTAAAAAAATSSSRSQPVTTRSYLVQWRYEETGDEWTFCQNHTLSADNGTVHVKDLQPYQKYRVSCALLELNGLYCSVLQVNMLV